MGVLMWHPGTDGTFEAPDEAVDHYRRAGWIRADERADMEAAQQAAQQAAADEAAGGKAAAKTPKTG